MFRSDLELAALLGESSQFVMRAEISGTEFQRFGPTFDAKFQGNVDILECLFGSGTGGRIAGLADPVENPASLRLLFGIEAEKRILESDVNVVRVNKDSLAELIAR